ncbi:hypothetical protein C8Q80DRAFT_1276345 [Daedaleopsis nitida]|nr:hypothetical protein C8Q80DRAFT_1276345 [Daedaleopsis nitida]
MSGGLCAVRCQMESVPTASLEPTNRSRGVVNEFECGWVDSIACATQCKMFTRVQGRFDISDWAQTLRPTMLRFGGGLPDGSKTRMTTVRVCERRGRPADGSLRRDLKWPLHKSTSVDDRGRCCVRKCAARIPAGDECAWS